jgi:hypothetical protein
MQVNSFTKSRIARLSGSVFWTLTCFVFGIDFAKHQGNLQLFTQSLAVACKAIGRRLQTMVNVNSPHLPWPLPDTRHQQSGGICTTAESDGQRERRLKTGRKQAHT